MRAVADAVAALALAAADAEPTRAEDLPAALVAAARLIPADMDEPWQRRVRLPIRIIGHGGPPIVVGTVAAGGAYFLATQGARLGVGPADDSAPPFARALLDASAAERVRLEWFARRIGPFTGVPVLWDTGTKPGAPPPTPPPREERVPMRAGACIATGPEVARFVHDPDDYLGGSLPWVETGGTDAGGVPAAATPPGVFHPSKFCHDLIPDRVLECDEPTANPNGRRQTVVVILFHLDRAPPWIADHRVIEGFQRWMRPDKVRTIDFSDYGDGWRPDASVVARESAPGRPGSALRRRARPGVRRCARRVPARGARGCR